MDIDKITIAIATYNRPLELKRAILSISSQRIARINIVISDDSPEGSASSVELSKAEFELDYAAQPKRLGVILNPLSLIDQCKGDMFMFLGDDDILLPLGLTYLSESLKTSSLSGGVFGSYLTGISLEKSKLISLSSHFITRLFSSEKSIIRSISYYLCPAAFGKQNIYYGLFKSSIVLSIRKNLLIPKAQIFPNMDEMFVFQALQHGQITIINQPCIYFAEGNEKLYKSPFLTRQNKLTSIFFFMAYEIYCIQDYFRNAITPRLKLLILFAFPLKILISVLYRIYLWLS